MNSVLFKVDGLVLGLHALEYAAILFIFMKKSILTIVLISFLSLMLHAEKKSIKLNENTVVVFDLPSNWEFRNEDRGVLGASVAITHSSRVRALMLDISLFPPEYSGEKEFLYQALNKRCLPFVESSIEQKIAIEEIPRAEGYACYTVFTDSRMNKSDIIQSGEFRVVAPGYVRLSDKYLLTFQILAQDSESSEFIELLNILSKIKVKVL